jgi:hypothetical protein
MTIYSRAFTSIKLLLSDDRRYFYGNRARSSYRISVVKILEIIRKQLFTKYVQLISKL